MIKQFTRWVLVGLFLAAGAGVSAAQTPGSVDAGTEGFGMRGVSFFRFVPPGKQAMRVNVWGDVRAPGRYEVEVGTDLLELVFLAGATTERATTYKQIRETTLRVSRKRDDGSGWRVIYEAALDDITDMASPIPDLQDEDVVKVETIVRQRLDWREALGIVGTVASLALLTDRLFNRSR